MSLLFIHIPKNGGMTVRRGNIPGLILAEEHNHVSPEYTEKLHRKMMECNEAMGDEHARWRDWRVDLRENNPAFAVVRNPWDRTVSRYTYMIRCIETRSGRWETYSKCKFGEFLEQRHRWGGQEFFWHRGIRGWFQQKDYVTDEDGNLRCDILRFGLDLTDYLGTELPPRNVSNGTKDGSTVVGKKDYRKFYGAEERRIIEEWYAEDIEYFGFTFDGHATKNIWKPT